MKRFLRKSLKERTILWVLLVLVILLYVVLGLVPALLLKYGIDSIIVPKNYEHLGVFIAIYLGTLVLIDLLEFAKQFLLIDIGEDIVISMKREMISKLSRMNISYFKEHSSGEITSRYSSDMSCIQKLFTNGIISMMIDSFKIIGILVSMFIFSYKLGLFTMLFIPFIFLLTRFFQKRMLKSQLKNRELVGDVSGFISETLENSPMIYNYQKQDYMNKEYDSILTENYKTKQKVNLYDSIYSPIIQIIKAIIIGIFVLLVSPDVGFIGISLGLVAASLDYISNLFSPIDNLGMELQSIQEAISGVKRVTEFLNLEEIEAGTKEIDESNELVYTISNMCFSYEKDKEVLKNINLELKEGTIYSIGGKTGVGKSTFLKLLMGYCVPTEGHIQLNSIDIHEIKELQYNKLIGYVSQNLESVYGTLFDQIALYREDITEQEVINAYQRVGLYEKICSFEKGLNTEYSDSLFSIGEKQSIACARLLVFRPRIILLDEITSYMDSIQEEKIYSLIKELFPNAMILSISHKLKGMLYSDVCIYMEKGEVKFFGDTNELKHQKWFEDLCLKEEYEVFK